METKFNLTALGPLDGRYHTIGQTLAPYFSEFAWFKYRTHVEIEYLIALAKTLKRNTITEKAETLRNIAAQFSEPDAFTIKQFEQNTQHDVKAVEYWLRARLQNILPPADLCLIHFGLTSQDINQTALPLMIQDADRQIIQPAWAKIMISLLRLKSRCSFPMLARTHGQPATPTTLHHELHVFEHRLRQQLNQNVTLTAKFGGAVGRFNTHRFAYPQVHWPEFADKFCTSLDLTRNPVTTQIDDYDSLAEYCHAVIRINTILTDLCRDMWTYISLRYFTLRTNPDQVGSSTMPQKINPILFEQSEANLGIANALLNHFANKLPISRLQRDLTDSSTVRNLGVALGHTMLAAQSIDRALGQIEPQPQIIQQDLNQHWEILLEAVQTALRAEGCPDAYELCKNWSRQHPKVHQDNLQDFIQTLPLSAPTMKRLLQLTPETY